jgi:hypothetical protein
MSLYALLTMGAGHAVDECVRDPMNVIRPKWRRCTFWLLLILQFMGALLGAQFGEMRRRLRTVASASWKRPWGAFRSWPTATA